MKMKIWKWALALVLASGLAVSCTEEEKEQEKVQLLDCSFKINISDITGNSVKLSAVPTKMSVKYWLSVVRKDIYKLYSSDTEFAADYLTDMKMNAAEKGIAFNEYVGANRISGYSPKLINGLSPQTDYVAYAYGLPEWTGEFHSMGILEDLSDRYANWDDASVLSDAVMKGMSIGDEIIGVPYEMTVRAYLCHENIMKKGGASVPATWDDVLSMTDFKDKTGTYPYALACTGVRAPQEMIVYLAQKGLEICSLQDDGMYKNTWKDNADQLAAAADVFQFYKDCIDSGVVDPNSKSFGYEETDDNFVNGFSASYVTGNWLQEKEDANPEVMSDVTVEPIPVPEGGTPATYMELKPLFLFNTSKNNDAAFDFATYVCGKEWQQGVYSSASPRSDVTVPGKWTEDFQALSDNGVAFPPVTLGSISQAMIDSIAKVLQEGMTPQAAAEWLADAVNTSLKESGELSAS